jgi:diaminopimelate epimerase
MLPFVKVTATGNDFILLEAAAIAAAGRVEAVARELCPRRTGVGADGLVIVRAPDADPDGAWEVTHLEPNGDRTFCLNALRGVAAWATWAGRWPEGAGGLLRTEVGLVPLRPSPDGWEAALPLPRSVEQITLDDLDGPLQATLLDVGNPQLVILLEDPAQLEAPNLMERGRRLRWRLDLFPDGANVDFVVREGADRVRLRTFERGVEDETLSCGTGVLATACALLERDGGASLRCHTRGGEVQVVTLDPAGDKVWSAAPARVVARGEALRTPPG